MYKVTEMNNDEIMWQLIRSELGFILLGEDGADAFSVLAKKWNMERQTTYKWQQISDNVLLFPILYKQDPQPHDFSDLIETRAIAIKLFSQDGQQQAIIRDTPKVHLTARHLANIWTISDTERQIICCYWLQGAKTMFWFMRKKRNKPPYDDDKNHKNHLAPIVGGAGYGHGYTCCFIPQTDTSGSDSDIPFKDGSISSQSQKTMNKHQK